MGSSFKGPCEDPELPVPCATKKGTCESDFISCLRAIGEEELEESNGSEGDLGLGLGFGGESGEKKVNEHFFLEP